MLAACAPERSAVVVTPAMPPADLAPAAISVANTSEGVPIEVVRHKNFVLRFGEHALEVDPADGGRIIAFSLAEKSVLASREESPEAYGSSFWPSPQSDWGWPPPPAFDEAPWQASADEGALLLTSGTDEKLALSATQRIFAVPEKGVFVIEHTLVNRGSAPRKVAPWQNTRVRPRGLTFFPSTAAPIADSPLALRPENGVAWFAHDPAAHDKGVKGFSDGAEGWLAHVDGELLFIKAFPDVPREAQAPKEAEIEIYVDGAGRFVEIEQQGPYMQLAPGTSSTWPVRWHLSRLPPGLSAARGSPELVAHVRAIVSKLQ